MDFQVCCYPIDFATPEYDETVKLRFDILRKPLNMVFDEQDLALEYDSIHIACYHTPTMDLLGCLVLKPLEEGQIKMRQVAVRDDMQGKGIGKIMIKYSESYAASKGYQKMVLHARMTATAFYQKLGYITEGQIFKEVGIDHLFMWKRIGKLTDDSGQWTDDN